MEINKYTKDNLNYLDRVRREGITFNREEIAVELFRLGLFKPFIYEIEREFGPIDSQFFGAKFGSGFEEDYGSFDIEYKFDYGTCKAKFVVENGMFIINISKHDSVDDVIYRIIHHFKDLFPDYAE